MIQLQDVIPAELIKKVLLFSITFLSISVSVLFVILIVDKLTTESREAKKRAYRSKYIQMITNALVGDEVKLEMPAKRLEYEALMDVCIDTLLSISGDIAEKLKAILKEMKLVDYYKSAAESRFWLKRYYSIEKLGFLSIDDLKDYFLDRLRKEKREEVKAKAVWALSLIADEEILKIITKELLRETSKSAKFDEYIYANIIVSFRRKGQADRFIAYVEEIKQDETIPALLKRDMIESCGSSLLHEAADIIVTYFHLHEDNPEMRIACIRALGKMGGPEACKLISIGFMSADWRVRTVAARAAYLCDEEVIPQLQKLLYDPVYFVRINASKALARLGEKGMRALESEVSSDDRFVKDTVRFILEDKRRNA